jgi:hypothetical protein
VDDDIEGDRELANLQAACDSLDAAIARIGESDAPCGQKADRAWVVGRGRQLGRGRFRVHMKPSTTIHGVSHMRSGSGLPGPPRWTRQATWVTPYLLKKSVALALGLGRFSFGRRRRRSKSLLLKQ